MQFKTLLVVLLLNLSKHGVDMWGTHLVCFFFQLLNIFFSCHYQVTATVSKRGLPIAQRIGVDDVILYDSRSPNEDFNLVLATRNKFDVVLNTVGSFLHDSCKKLCAEGGVVVSTVSTPPASDHYGIFFGSLYSWMLRIMLLFQRVLGACFRFVFLQILKFILFLGSHLQWNNSFKIGAKWNI